MIVYVLFAVAGWFFGRFLADYFFARKMRRMADVLYFRMWIIENRLDLYDKLPPREQMIKDNKPLKLESYFTEAEITCLN